MTIFALQTAPAGLGVASAHLAHFLGGVRESWAPAGDTTHSRIEEVQRVSFEYKAEVGAEKKKYNNDDDQEEDRKDESTWPKTSSSSLSPHRIPVWAGKSPQSAGRWARNRYADPGLGILGNVYSYA